MYIMCIYIHIYISFRDSWHVPTIIIGVSFPGIGSEVGWLEAPKKSWSALAKLCSGQFQFMFQSQGIFQCISQYNHQESSRIINHINPGLNLLCNPKPPKLPPEMKWCLHCFWRHLPGWDESWKHAATPQVCFVEPPQHGLGMTSESLFETTSWAFFFSNGQNVEAIIPSNEMYQMYQILDAQLRKWHCRPGTKPMPAHGTCTPLRSPTPWHGKSSELVETCWNWIETARIIFNILQSPSSTSSISLFQSSSWNYSPSQFPSFRSQHPNTQGAIIAGGDEPGGCPGRLIYLSFPWWFTWWSLG